MSVDYLMLHGGVGMVSAAGYMNAEGGDRIADKARDLLDRGCEALLIDLRGTRLVNHQGLAALHRLRDEVVRRGARLAFRNLSATVARIFDIVGLSCEEVGDQYRLA